MGLAWRGDLQGRGVQRGLRCRRCPGEAGVFVFTLADPLPVLRKGVGIEDQREEHMYHYSNEVQWCVTLQVRLVGVQGTE